MMPLRCLSSSRSNAFIRWVLLALLTGSAAWMSGLSQEPETSPDVVIENRDRPRQIRSRLLDGKRLLSLRDLSRALDLRQKEEGSQVRLEGARGALVLTDTRTIVSSPGPDILLSAPAWRRRKGDWYVPEDFLVRALPLILDAALNRSAPQRYRLESVLENRVAVRLADHPPNKVRIVFQPQRDAPIRISELPSFLLVEFSDYRVVPTFPDKQADPRIVASLDFNPHHQFGSFRIFKGERFGRFEEFQLQAPLRQVVDAYAAEPDQKSEPPVPPAVVSIPSFTASREPDPVAVTPPAASRDISAPDSEIAARRPVRPVIALDPGHGGLDGGQPLSDESSQQLLEKAFALKIAQLIRQRLDSTPFEAVLTRTRDVDLNLEQRSAIANFYHPRAFISLHWGRSRSASASGPVVYLHSRQPGVSPASGGPGQELQLLHWEEGQQPHLEGSRRLAELLQQKLNAVFQSRNRVVQAPLTVLAPLNAPAVLIELGFVSNSDDAERLRSPEFQERIAAAVAAALEEFLS